MLNKVIYISYKQHLKSINKIQNYMGMLLYYLYG